MDIFELLQGLPNWFQMVFISIAVFLIGYILIMLLQKINTIKYKKGNLTINSDIKNKNCNNKSPHAGCPHAKDIVILLNDTIKIMTRKFEIIFFSTLRQQMNCTEEIVDQIIVLMQKTYLNLLQKKGIENLIHGHSYSMYRVILMIVKRLILDSLRNSFREDKISEMNDITYIEYMESKIDSLISQLNTHLNDLYSYDTDITIEELYAENKLKFSEYKAIFKIIFNKARKVALENNKELNILDKNLETVFEKIS